MMIGLDAYRRNIRSMTLSNWSYVLVWSMISFAQFGFAGVLFNFYLLDLGYDKAQIGSLLAMSNLVMAVVALPAGFVGARISPHKALKAGFLSMVAGWGLLLTAPILLAPAMNAAIIAGQMLVYLGYAMILVNGVPFFMQITNETNRVFIIAFQQLFQGGMGIMGALLGGILPGLLIRLSGNSLNEMNAFRVVLAIIPVLYIFTFLVLHRLPQVPRLVIESSKVEKSAQRRFPGGAFAYIILIVFLMAVGWGGFSSFLNLFLADLGYSTEQIGPLMSISQVMPFLSAATVPLLNQRLKIGSLFGMSSLMLATGAFFLSINHLPFVIVICLLFDGYARAVINTTRSLYSQSLVAPYWRTYISAVNIIALAAGFAAASGAGGVLIESSGFASLFRLSAAAALASGLITLAYPHLKAFLASKTADVPIEAD